MRQWIWQLGAFAAWSIVAWLALLVAVVAGTSGVTSGLSALLQAACICLAAFLLSPVAIRLDLPRLSFVPVLLASVPPAYLMGAFLLAGFNALWLTWPDTYGVLLGVTCAVVGPPIIWWARMGGHLASAST